MKQFNSVLSLAASLLLVLYACGGPAVSQDADFTISTGWVIHSSDNASVRYDAEVPSTVLGTLTANGLYADALVGTNYDKVIDRDDFSRPWWYENEFSLPELKPGQRVTLDFEGISYSAEIWLNGKQLGFVTGPFRQFRFDVTDLVAEKNLLAVKVNRAEAGDFNIGFVDWNPRAADESMGIYRPVWVRYSDAVSVTNTAVRSKVDLNTLKKAWLTVETTLKNMSDEDVEGELVYTLEGRTFTRPVTMASGEEKVVTIGPDDAKMFNIRNPRLWWCHNLGSPEMYSMDVAFITGGKVSDSQTVDFGIRQIDTYMTGEGHRGFILNGKKVLVKGAGWTDDIFLRNPPERNEIELDYVKDMNMNTVRFENVWGTSQNVYDLCDRKGLLALVGWSCFWEWEVYSRTPNDEFGCIKTEEDMVMIAESFRDQILWLRNHPSIIAWYSGSDMLPRPALEKKYLDILPEIDDRPYIAAAKGLVSEVSGPTGMKMVGPYDYVAPVYWYSPEAPGGAFGFNTETGIGAQMPVKESVMKMIPEKERWPVGKAYDYHCTTAGEAMHSLDVLKKVINDRYGRPSDLDDFLRNAHHVDYDGTRAMFEAFRVNVPRSTGIIQWMLNSAWPSVYWQMYDWYLVPCSGYWSVKKACAPQQLVYNYYDHHVYAVNDEASDFGLRAEAEVYNLEGQQVSSVSCDVDMTAGCSIKLFEIPDQDAVSFLFLKLTDAAGAQVADNVYCLSPVKDVNDWDRSNWIRTPLRKSADYRGLDSLAPASLDVKASSADGGLEVTLINDSGTVAFFVRMALKDASGELVIPAFWEDNLVTLRPGESRTYSCGVASGLPENCIVEISGWNVATGIVPVN